MSVTRFREFGVLVGDFPSPNVATHWEGMIDSGFLSLARHQFGVVSRTQLDDLGVSSARLSRARRAGKVVDVTTRTVRIASSPDTFLARATAVSLHLGERGFLSGSTAGRVRGLRDMPIKTIDVVVPAGDRPRLPAWTHVRSSSWFDEERDRRTMPGGLVVAEPHRMLYDLAARLRDRRFRRAADDCWHLGLVTPESAGDFLRRHRCRGKDGTARMERWVADATEQGAPAESGLERDLLEAIDRIGLPVPVRQHVVVLPTGAPIRLDLAWPDIRLGVEPGHSWWHGGVDGIRRDNERRLGAQAIGWEIVQLDESLRTDPSRTARTIRTIHDRRSKLLAS